MGNRKMILYSSIVSKVLINKGCNSPRERHLKCYGCQLYWQCSVAKLCREIELSFENPTSMKNILWNFRYHNVFYERELSIEISK